ncbi:MAG: hypothetical protein AYK22_00145 [Thermoplasmatales archaeon SG8-52-3]|nr:MAG: hypothetical protein AYK22_00145 [Thermoplasmatales archaeon SG8-52-3]
MKKKILFGCIIVACVLMLLPSTSAAESNSIKDRILLKETIQKQIDQNPIYKVSSHEPACILRLLLIIRNLLLLGIVGIIGIIFTLLNLINNSSA